MDAKLVAWARSVKSRSRRRGIAPPPLWLFTDADRMPNLLQIVAALPKGLCGVVFRHGNVAERPQLARSVWRTCQARQLAMVVAGHQIAGIRAGTHLRRGRRSQASQKSDFSTSSAHNVPELVQARRAHAKLAFLSPVFPTASHQDMKTLGVLRWAAMARQVKNLPILALGGIDGINVRRLPKSVAGIGAIAAFLDPPQRCVPIATVFRHYHDRPGLPIASADRRRQ